MFKVHVVLRKVKHFDLREFSMSLFLVKIYTPAQDLYNKANRN